MTFKSQIAFAPLFIFCAKLHALNFDLYFNLDPEAKKHEKQILKESELFSSSKQNYNSLFALKEQGYEDARSITDYLQSIGYLEANTQVYIDTEEKKPLIIFEIKAGPLFYFENLIFDPPFDFALNIQLSKKAASSSQITTIENEIIKDLKNEGYAFAKINESKISINSARSADVYIHYDKGMLYHFGDVEILGLNKVKKELIEKKIPWKTGDVFNDSELKKLQKLLLDTQLFSEVTIKIKEPIKDRLPILIELGEAPFKTISVGVSYQTHFGAGGDLSFEHRNISNSGQKFVFETSVTQNSLLGKLSYSIPSFIKEYQKLDFKFEASREQLYPSFTDNLYDFSIKLNANPSKYVFADYGFSSRYYLVTHSVKNGSFYVLMPYVRLSYDTTYQLLDPKEGFKIILGNFFYQNLAKEKSYFSNSLKGSFYTSFFKNNLTLASQCYVGTFYNSTLHDIPVPLRFFGGTDEYLRGYRYYTVSPLDKGKPTGGRSALFSNLELRFTIKNPFGMVLFYDSGFVSKNVFFWDKSPYYQSLGFGFRYYSFVGPLRIDVGFPLDPRKKLDSKFKILASFGHTF